MAKTFTDDQSLFLAIQADMMQPLTHISSEIAGEVIWNVGEVVYSLGPGTTYERWGSSGGFIGSWTYTPAELDGLGKIVSKVFSDPERMKLGGSQMSHGDESSDRRPFMSQYIIEGTNYDFGGNAMYERDFWTPFMEGINEGVLDRYVEKVFKRYGFKFKKVS